MIPTSVNGPGGSSQTASTAIIGIASLILEGRAISDDEFIITQTQRQHHQKPSASYSSYHQQQQQQHKYGYAANSNDIYDPTLMHMQRLREKLGQLRQTSPSTSRGDQLTSEQTVSIGLENMRSLGGGGGVVDNDEADDSDDIDEFLRPASCVLQRRSLTNDNKLLTTLQTLASTCLRSETFVTTTTKSIKIVPPTSTTTTTATTRSTCDKVKAPKQGPHCDQFLRKVGLTKVDATADIEEHICDIANLNEICYRWQLHCRQIDLIMSRMDPIYIEVYLGPENNEILLEQWIIKQREKSTIQNMTLQSLANAIRSQLYFSQITAWADSLKNAKSYDREIFEHGRIKFIENGTIRKPRLDIFYRIKGYDSIACFTAKPNVHDFPNVVISENCSISVCLKSLPRIVSGIPRIEDSPNNSSCSSNSCSSGNSGSSHNSHHNHSGSGSSSTNNNTTGCSTAGGVLATAIMSPHDGTDGGSTDQSNSSIDESMILDDRMNLPCQEKGKHRCPFDDEYGSSDTAIESMSSAELTHREKQLLKYRKRIMKRDKKTKSATATASSSSEKSSSSTVNIAKGARSMNERPLDQHEAMQFGEKTDNHNLHPQQQPAMSEFGSINSYRPPLYQTQHASSIAEAVQTNFVETVSVGTQTVNFTTMPSCRCCGNQMQLVCTQCDSRSKQQQPQAPRGLLAITPNQYPATPNKSTASANGTTKLAKGDILLQAIVRTPQHKLYDVRNNNNNNGSKTASKSKTNDCQLCKRQKTQHHYPIDSENSSNRTATSGSNNSSYTESDQLAISADSCDTHMSSDCSCTDEYSDNCCRQNSNGFHPIQSKIVTTPSTTRLANDFKLSDNIDAQFKTPKCSAVLASPRSLHKPTPLYINCSEKLTSGKSIPKINLFNMFNGNNSTMKSPTISSASEPIPIATASSSIELAAAAFTFDNINSTGQSPDIPVQKSNSAPALPNSPSLSPRFLKQAAIYRRRARHLSDRSSERSSIGSDEQFSDEDLESLYSPTSSPTKTRMFRKSSGFGRRPLVGSFEECLLQKRFVPKSQVAGFKVLLGASGIFCPTQLTIPAVANFCELSNETSLSTPYMCEIHLPRKGYTVPRVGNIQATLLNPLGTVVRMFVIPYDFRDMPAMSQTFIRQRVLAVDSADETMSGNGTAESSISGLGHSDLSFGEQMRSLRYAIHLRFQTTRTNRLALHTDIRLLISRRTDCDTAAAHAKDAPESPNELKIITIKPDNPKYSARQENPNKI